MVGDLGAERERYPRECREGELGHTADADAAEDFTAEEQVCAAIVAHTDKPLGASGDAIAPHAGDDAADQRGGGPRRPLGLQPAVREAHGAPL